MVRRSELILAIETSCDETAAAVVANGKEIISNIVSSQVNLHRKFGGVVPEIASRKHLELINPIILEVLNEAEVNFNDLSAIAVTLGPGLVGALLIGLSTAKALAYTNNLPLVGVNHLEGHIFANFLEHKDLEPPFICLIVSGGHTTLILVKDIGDYEIMGETLDDAAGEAFDKIAGFLELGYPGGPIIDNLAREGNSQAVSFPRAMLHTKDFDFSLSGLKTAVLNYVAHMKNENKPLEIPDLCASFQAAVIDVLVSKSIRAAKEREVEKIVLAGGVAANKALRDQFKAFSQKENFKLYYPSVALCTDNAAMIGCAGYYRFKAGERLSLDAYPDPNLKLGRIATSDAR
jgi:N6-L-threonylcarbamoyladenine synthase